MERLRTSIVSSRIKNVNGQHFVPKSTIVALITAASVRDTLKDCGIVVHSLEELVQTILEGARTVFAVLVVVRQVQQVGHFVKHDQFQSPLVYIDHKLPFSLETLDRIIGSETAREFFEKQWEFAAPFFSRRLLPRYLGEDTVLPILKTRPIGEGGFGEAHEISIHPDHSNFGEGLEQTVLCLRQGKHLTNEAFSMCGKNFILTQRIQLTTKSSFRICRY